MLKLCDILDEKEKVLHEVSTEATFPLDKKYFELIDEAYQNAIRLLQEHRDKLDLIAETLLQKEKINEEEFKEFWDRSN